MCALVSFTENCGANPLWADWSWSTETPYPGLLLVYLLMDTDSLPFVLHWILLAVPNIHDTKRGTSSFKSRNIDDRTPSFASRNMYLGWRRDNLSCQDLNYYCKSDWTYKNIMPSIYCCVRFFDSFIYFSEEIGIDPISGTFLDLRNFLINNNGSPIKNLMMYLVLSGSIVFTPLDPPSHCVPHLRIWESCQSGRVKLDL